jgi:hypothetical protein
MSPRTWGKVTFGLLVIGGTLGGLWAAFRPSLPGVETEASRPAGVPALRDARAAVVLSAARSPRTWRAVIACDGRRRSATGFWARRPAAACDALAATRGALPRGGRLPAHAAGPLATSRDGLVRRTSRGPSRAARRMPGPGRLAGRQRARPAGSAARAGAHRGRTPREAQGLLHGEEPRVNEVIAVDDFRPESGRTRAR